MKLILLGSDAHRLFNGWLLLASDCAVRYPFTMTFMFTSTVGSLVMIVQQPCLVDKFCSQGQSHQSEII